MAIKGDMYYRIIYVNESLSGALEFMVRGFDSEDSFIEAKSSPKLGSNHIRYEMIFNYPLIEYDQSLPLRAQLYSWLAKNGIEGTIIDDVVI